MSSLYADLTRLRLRWYVTATAHVVRRHWQWFVIASLVVPSATPPTQIVKALAFPVVGMVRPGHEVLWYALHLALVQAAALGWVWLQREALAGGPMASYASTLPFRRVIVHRANAALLLVADSLLLLPGLAALIITPAQPGDLPAGIFHAISVAALVLMALSAQQAALERDGFALSLALAPGMPWAWSLAHNDTPGAWMLLALTASAALVLVYWTPALRMPRSAARRRPREKPATAGLSTTHWLPITARIQANALLVDQLPATTLRLAAAIGIVVGADLLIGVFGFDARTLPTAILAMAASALILSGSYRGLASAHASMDRYSAALPLAKSFWIARDIGFVMLLAVLPLAILLVPLIKHTTAPAWPRLVLAAADLGLIALLRLPLLVTKRQTVLVGALLAGGWSAAAMAAIH